MIRQTSIEAYHEIESDGTALSQEDRVFGFIQSFDGLTRNEISRNLSIPINAVCGRVNSLIRQGRVYEDGKRPDKYSQKQNYILKAVRNGGGTK